MKKKYLLIALLAVIFSCIFALSVDAATTNEFGTVETIEGINLEGMNTDSDARVVLVESDGVTYHTYPSNYIVTNSESLTFDFSRIGNDGSGKAYTTASIIRFEVPKGVTSIPRGTTIGTSATLVELILANDLETVGFGLFYGYTALTNVTIGSKVTKIEGNTFLGCKNISRVDISDLNAWLRITFDKDSSNPATFAKGVYLNGELVTSVTIPSDITKINSFVFAGFSSLTSITLHGGITEIGNSAFSGTSITAITMPNSVTSIGTNTFSGCKSLVNATLSENITAIPEGAFQSCFYLVMTIPDNVETIGDNAFNAACYNDGSITINKTSKLKSIGFKAFYDVKEVQDSLYMPSSLETVGSYAFANSGFSSFENLENTQITVLENSSFSTSSYTELKLPKNLTKIGSNAIFIGSVVYVPKTVTEVTSSSFFSHWKSGKVIFTGDSADLLKTCTKLADATVIDASEYDETATYSGFNIVIGYNHCVAFYDGEHNKEETNACVSTCNRCNSTFVIHAEDAKLVVTITYTSYTVEGEKVTTCSNAGCEYNEKGTAPALFTCQGYSVAKSDNAGILIGFAINKNAISAYESTGKEISYGLFAGLYSNLGSNEAVSTDGVAQKGAVCADFTTRGYDIMEIKVSGIETEEHKKALIVMGAYVIETNGEEKTVSYLQSGEVAEGEKYVSTSYNDLVPTE